MIFDGEFLNTHTYAHSFWMVKKEEFPYVLGRDERSVGLFDVKNEGGRGGTTELRREEEREYFLDVCWIIMPF